MRNGIAVSLVAASLLIGSCGDDDAPGMTPPPGEDGSTPPPTPPTPVPPPPTSDGGVIVPTPPPGMEAMVAIDLPEFELGPYEENTFCYYTTVRTDGELGIRGWESSMSEGSHHLIMFFTREASRPDGTLEECGLTGLAGGAGIGGVPIWAYAAQEPESHIDFPDGVGFPFTTEQHLFVQIHYLNPSGETIRPNVQVRGRAYPQGTDFIRAGVFATFNTEIDVPPGESASARGSCELSGTENFFLISTHSHQFTTSARVYDGENMVVDTTDWEHPAVQQWNAEPFYHFTSGALDYECTYQNPTRERIRTGDSAQTDEMCMGVGYFFPSRGMRFCFNDRVISL